MELENFVRPKSHDDLFTQPSKNSSNKNYPLQFRNPERSICRCIKKNPSDTTRNRILIVEDETVARTRLQAILARDSAYQISAVASATEAQQALRSQDFDIVLLDIHLPDADDFHLAASIGDKIAMGLIIISAYTDDDRRLQGLRCGADDYLSKPYNGEELLIKVNKLAQRIAESKAAHLKIAHLEISHRLRFGSWTYDPEAMILYQNDGQMIKLSSHEKRLLTLFLNNPSRVFSRQQLLDALHPDNTTEVFDRAIDSAIARLRRRIEIDPKKPKILKTIYGEGYVFDTRIQRLDH